MRGIIKFLTRTRKRRILRFAAAVVIFGLLGLLIVAGLAQPRKWSLDIWVEGLTPGTASGLKTPPYGLLTNVIAFHEDGTSAGIEVTMP